MINILANILIVAGLFFAITSVLGVVRMRDFYTKSHPASIIDSFSLPLIVAGFLIKFGLSIITVKLLFLVVFSLVTSATASHALTRASIEEKKPFGKVDDDYKDKL